MGSMAVSDLGLREAERPREAEEHQGSRVLSPAPPPPLQPPHVVVIGAGIIGVSIAYHLAVCRGGARVTVLDKQPSPGSGCTQGAFAMLIASHSTGPAELNHLYGLAVAEWRQLEVQLGEPLPIQWGGIVNWAAPGPAADELTATHERLRRWGVRMDDLAGAEDVGRLVPGALAGEFGAGRFLPDHGALDVAQTLDILVRRTKALGVTFHTSVEVFDIETQSETEIETEARLNVSSTSSSASSSASSSLSSSSPPKQQSPPAAVRLKTNNGLFEADKVVIAAGVGTPGLADPLLGTYKIPLDIVSGTLAYSKPMPPLLHRILNGPVGSIRQNTDGRIVTGLDYAPTDVHDNDNKPQTQQDVGGSSSSIEAAKLNAYGQTLLARAAQVVPALAGAELERVTVGHVPIPRDSRPVVGFCDGATNPISKSMSKSKSVYVATMMSGITLAPLMGRLAATEILGHQSLSLLEPYRPSRFAAADVDADAASNQ